MKRKRKRKEYIKIDLNQFTNSDDLASLDVDFGYSPEIVNEHGTEEIILKELYVLFDDFPNYNEHFTKQLSACKEILEIINVKNLDLELDFSKNEASSQAIIRDLFMKISVCLSLTISYLRKRKFENNLANVGRTPSSEHILAKTIISILDKELAIIMQELRISDKKTQLLELTGLTSNLNLFIEHAELYDSTILRYAQSAKLNTELKEIMCNDFKKIISHLKTRFSIEDDFHYFSNDHWGGLSGEEAEIAYWNCD